MLLAHRLQRLTDQRPVCRIVVTQQRFMQTALFITLRHHYLFALITDFTQRVLTGVIHRGRVRQRRRIEVLHLVETEAMFLQPQRQVHHILITSSRVGGDKVRDQILLFTCLLRIGIKQLFKAVVAAHARLHHLRQRPLFGMLRGDFQIATDVVGCQLFDIARIFNRDIIAYAGGNEDFLDTLQLTGAAIKIDRRLMVGIHVRANIRVDAGETAAGLFGAWRFTAQHIHVGRWPAEIGDHPGKAGHRVANGFDLIDDRILRTALNNASFVFGDRAERTAAEAAAHDVDRETDHLIRRDTRIAIRRVRHTLVRQGEDAVHLFGRERDRRRVDPDIALAMLLHQRPGAARVGFVVQNARGVSIQDLIAFHLLKGGQQYIGFFPRFGPRRLHGDAFRFLLFRRNRFVVCTRQVFTIRMRDRIDFARGIQAGGIHAAPARQRLFHHDGGIAHIADLVNGFAHRQTMRHFHQRALAVAEHQHIGLGIHQHRAAHSVGPVIIMRGTAQAGFDAAEDHRHIFPRLFTALGVDQSSAVRAFARHVTRRIGIVMTQLTVGGVAVDHRVHVAGGHAEEQVRFAQPHEIVFGVPVWLGDDPYPETLRFQHAAADSHPEARVVDVSVARHQNNVAAIPAKLIHLFTRHR